MSPRGPRRPSSVARVHRVIGAVDYGMIVTSDTIRTQMQGGIVYGLTAAPRGVITLEIAYVQQRNFDSYVLSRIDECTVIDVHSSDAPGGVGEPGVPPAAAAVAKIDFLP